MDSGRGRGGHSRPVLNGRHILYKPNLKGIKIRKKESNAKIKSTIVIRLINSSVLAKQKSVD